MDSFRLLVGRLERRHETEPTECSDGQKENRSQNGDI